jgi:hypothetical protein
MQAKHTNTQAAAVVLLARGRELTVRKPNRGCTNGTGNDRGTDGEFRSTTRTTGTPDAGNNLGELTNLEDESSEDS